MTNSKPFHMKKVPKKPPPKPPKPPPIPGKGPGRPKPPDIGQ